ncbi:late embryogenesis abundant protein 47 isoform X1 [Selaginella moellendorffii]|uniref:late embryogenesis abundant protein 47 isoform X1 n=1 Tax=Selaginella moellendorffii TaxID=88036 RepID=UPI000D1CBD40|nr:late embryogenesis abundant protein 47 isoform X1 [Selaginella moellendorffii]|eukprot:XP_024525871.1 late embryogenesis abundant protein 47 isoform X1 [Selaginella moellendorffii]
MRGIALSGIYRRSSSKLGSPGAAFSTIAARQQQQQQQVNYGADPKPQPNPAAKPLDIDAQRRDQQQQQQPQVDGQAKTIGDALEEAAAKSGDKPLELKDTRVIQSAEARATGAAAGVLGGPAQYATRLYENAENATLGEALQDVKAHLPADKVATPRDATRIEQAEQRNDPMGRVDPAGVAAAVKEAADYNVEKGFVAPGTPAGAGRV